LFYRVGDGTAKSRFGDGRLSKRILTNTGNSSSSNVNCSTAAKKAGIICSSTGKTSKSGGSKLVPSGAGTLRVSSQTLERNSKRYMLKCSIYEAA